MMKKMYDETLTRKKQADIDTEEYRSGYPDQEDNLDLNENYQFFMNEIPSKPQGDYIDTIHEQWWGDYTKPEENRKYMQWLFPVRRKSCNREAQELQPHEIQRLKLSEDAVRRLLTSFKMMLDFYGMKLKNEEDGTIVRAENWKERFEHLNRSEHNHW
ncbi:opioid growth factor receptor-like protein 1 [Mercenaria mercenaria]|uniref:opioid growth factor receptor-like protein 1 n=1 Tax=Mercenaria mercenaria TaxID=6596 RepID=UPI00234FAEAC|nr:opioid growth factor receptor-like protein 1 [Mercenaria mercenaria]XP_053384238.1 opioid growth factor receptor-like protein 1 [Mercenaria mercenaria]